MKLSGNDKINQDIKTSNLLQVCKLFSLNILSDVFLSKNPELNPNDPSKCLFKIVVKL